MYRKILCIIAVFLLSPQASGRFGKIYEKEKGEYFIYFDYVNMSDICHVNVSTKNKDYDCFADQKFKHTRCDSTEKSEKEKQSFDSVLASTKKLVSDSKFKDKRKVEICKISGFGYIAGLNSISCTYTRKTCDSCENEAPLISNSCLDSREKEKIIDELREKKF